MVFEITQPTFQSWGGWRWPLWAVLKKYAPWSMMQLLRQVSLRSTMLHAENAKTLILLAHREQT